MNCRRYRSSQNGMARLARSGSNIEEASSSPSSAGPPGQAHLKGGLAGKELHLSQHRSVAVTIEIGVLESASGDMGKVELSPRKKVGQGPRPLDAINAHRHCHASR